MDLCQQSNVSTFNMLSRFVRAFLPRTKHLLISWLQSPSAMILEPKKIKSVTVSIVSPSICHEVMGLDAMIFVFWMLNFKPTFSLFSHLKDSSGQSLSHVQLFAAPWTTACQASVSITNSQSSLRLTSIESVMPSNHLILCCPLLLLPSIFPNINQGLFQWVSTLHQVAKLLEFQIQHLSFQWILRTDFL